MDNDEALIEAMATALLEHFGAASVTVAETQIRIAAHLPRVVETWRRILQRLRERS